MVLDDLVVVVSEDALVVVDETDEATGDVTEVVLADCQTRGDLEDIIKLMKAQKEEQKADLEAVFARQRDEEKKAREMRKQIWSEI